MLLLLIQPQKRHLPHQQEVTITCLTKFHSEMAEIRMPLADSAEMVPSPSEGDMPDAQSTDQHLSSKKHASQNPEIPTNSENLSPGDNMEMEANSGDILVASLASLPDETYWHIVDVNRQFHVHQSLLGTSMNEMQMETPMVSGGSRDPPPSP
jgi:hypothetical protein